MALVVDPYTATPGATIAAAEINARIAAIIAQVNGNLDAANYKDASVTKAKLASDALQAFLQLATPGTRKIKWGVSATGSLGGTPQVSWTIPHGLGTTPTVAFVIAGGISTFGSVPQVPVVGSVISFDATNLTAIFRTSNNDNTNNSTPVYWVVIG